MWHRKLIFWSVIGLIAADLLRRPVATIYANWRGDAFFAYFMQAREKPVESQDVWAYIAIVFAMISSFVIVFAIALFIFGIVFLLISEIISKWEAISRFFKIIFNYTVMVILNNTLIALYHWAYDDPKLNLNSEKENDMMPDSSMMKYMQNERYQQFKKSRSWSHLK